MTIPTPTALSASPVRPEPCQSQYRAQCREVWRCSEQPRGLPSQPGLSGGEPSHGRTQDRALWPDARSGGPDGGGEEG